jgi:hypothetical protein
MIHFKIIDNNNETVGVLGGHSHEGKFDDLNEETKKYFFNAKAVYLETTFDFLLGEGFDLFVQVHGTVQNGGKPVPNDSKAQMFENLKNWIQKDTSLDGAFMNRSKQAGISAHALENFEKEYLSAIEPTLQEKIFLLNESCIPLGEDFNSLELEYEQGECRGDRIKAIMFEQKELIDSLFSLAANHEAIENKARYLLSDPGEIELARRRELPFGNEKAILSSASFYATKMETAGEDKLDALSQQYAKALHEDKTFSQRNVWMMEKMDRMKVLSHPHKEDEIPFISVGLAHLYGAYGLKKLLIAKGYRLEVIGAPEKVLNKTSEGSSEDHLEIHPPTDKSQNTSPAPLTHTYKQEKSTSSNQKSSSEEPSNKKTPKM